MTGGDQEQIGQYDIHEDGGVHRDVDVMITGPDGATFTATATRVTPWGS